MYNLLMSFLNSSFKHLGHNFNICSLFSSLLYSLPQLSHIKLKLEAISLLLLLFILILSLISVSSGFGFFL